MFHLINKTGKMHIESHRGDLMVFIQVPPRWDLRCGMRMDVLGVIRGRCVVVALAGFVREFQRIARVVEGVDRRLDLRPSVQRLHVLLQ